MRRFGVMLVFVLILVADVSGADIQVDNVRGDDFRDGGTGRGIDLGQGSLRTIGRALQLAHPGDRIVLTKNDEPYRESLTLQGSRHRGWQLWPLVIDGRGATIDGTSPVPPSAWRFVRKDLFQFDPLIRSTGLLYKDGQPAARPASGRHTALEPGQGLLEGGLVWFRIENGKLPSSEDLRWTAQTVGITLYDVHDIVIRDLIVQGFALDGINLHDGATNIELTRVSLRGNGRSGLHVGGACRATLHDSHASDNGRAQVHVEGACRLHLRQNEFLEDSAPAIRREGGAITGDVPVNVKQARAEFVDRSERLH